MIAGIVCEYNPFHYGHQFQIDKLKQELGAEAIVCALSGNFLQRGEPALIPKERRAMMALSCGVDLVVELPALYATRSANWFALGGVSLLAAAGATHLAFGAETNDLPALVSTAERLANPDRVYLEGFRRYLTAGLSFSEAQAKALNDGGHHNFVPSLPNDRLALSYLQIIAEKGLPMTPLLIPRSGSAFHDTQLSGGKGRPASAAAIRKRLGEGAAFYHTRSFDQAKLQAMGVAGHMPASALPYLADTRLVFPSDAAPIQLALLRRADRQDLLALPDMNEGLEYRILEAAGRSADLESFYVHIKTKRYTMTRLQRMVTHLHISYRESHAAFLRDGPPYLRVLGANATGRQLLHQARKACPLPIVTKTSQMKALAKDKPHAANAWEIERRATGMYSLLSGADISGGNPEYFLRSIML